MNYILQLSGFFQRVAADNRLNPTHVSLYMAIFQFWNAGRFQNPVSISRQELMRISKICAKATYHKCIKDLHSFGYLQYLPSFNPFKGSLVYMFDMQSSAKLVSALDRTNIETSIEQALAPYINKENILNLNIENENTRPQNDIVLKVSKKGAKVVEINGEKVPSKNLPGKSTPTIQTIDNFPPTLAEISKYFLEQNSNEVEAQKFFNHFQSNGWKVGGKAPMKDWQAAAGNWILNIPQFTSQPKITQKKNKLPNNSTQPVQKITLNHYNN